MSTAEIKEKFIEYFEGRDHRLIPNSSLMPELDPTLLFINSGMAPLKNYFTGQEIPPSSRMVNIQRCLRTEDLDAVGTNTRTLTFFEMLGSWSVDGYGKTEAVHFAYELLTGVFKLDADKIYATFFEGNDQVEKDSDTYSAWLNAGLPDERIIARGAKDNLWQSGPVGPCGPCTEVLYDRGPAFGIGESGTPETDPERFMEIWNAGVFMQYDRQADGSLKPLPFMSVDTGAGLERLGMVLTNLDSVYDLDVFRPIIIAIEDLSGKKYSDPNQDVISFRILADHMRAVTMCLGDSIMPSNTGRGYVVRRLLRRAIMVGRKLEINGYFTEIIAESVISSMGESYPNLHARKQEILTILKDEEEQFGIVLETGERLFEKLISKNESGLSAQDAFALYDTNGLPLSAIEHLAETHAVTIDVKGFNRLLSEQQTRSREASMTTKNAGEAKGPEVAKNHTAAHLLNEALRRIVDPGIHQAGQDLNSERLRFDFTFSRALTEEELSNVEVEVNKIIKEDLPVTISETSFEEAQKAGAQALFADKYKSVDQVTMYSIGDYSKELCGGPHVTHTGELGSFKILKQESVGRGVRRIKAKAE